MDIRQIQSFLIQNDYSPTTKGFYALADALKIALDTPEDIVSTTWLYREVAQLHHTSWQSVEHNIRLTVQNPVSYTHLLNDRSAAWTGVQYLFTFLTTNLGPGPYGRVYPLEAAEPGDIIQLSFDGVRYAHSLLVTQTGAVPSVSTIMLTSRCV